MPLLKNKSKLEGLASTIIKLLEQKTMTVNDIVEETGTARSSVYKVINDLIENGYVVNATPSAYRNVKYGLGNFKGRKDFIPRLTYKNKTFKAPVFLNTTPEDTVLPLWKELFGGLAVIFKTAERLHDKKIEPYEADVRIRAQRARILKAKAELDSLTNFVQQILDSNGFWDMANLSRMPKDEGWRPGLVDQMLNTLGELNEHLNQPEEI